MVYSILSQVIFVFKMTSSMSDIIFIQNPSNYSFEYTTPSPTVTTVYLEGTLGLDEFNYTNTTGYETVVERVGGLIDMLITPCLVTIGITGNLLSLYVFYFSKLRHQSTSQYLSALAISDSLFLIELIPPWLSTMEINGIFHQEPYCKGFVYVSYVSCCLSSWLVIAFTIERFVAVQYPLRSHTVCTVRRARYIIAALTIGAMIVNIPVINFAGSTNQQCHIDREKLEQAAKFNWVDTTFTFTVPLILIIFFNTWIAVLVYKLEKDRMKLAQIEQMSQQKSIEYDFIYLRSQRRITNMLLIVSTTFVMLNCPAYTLRVCGYAYDMESRELDDRWLMAQTVATMLFYTNFGINFFLYCLTGQNFRRALVQTVPCFGWLATKMGTIFNRSTNNQLRTCNVTTSAATTGTEAMCMETSFSRPDARRAHRRSGEYIMRWTFDNSRQRRATAATSRPGPSRYSADDRMLPGPSHDFSSGQTRAIIESTRPAIERKRPAIDSVVLTMEPVRSDIEVESMRPRPPRVTVGKKRKSSRMWRLLQLFRHSGAQRRRDEAHLYD